MRRCRTTVHFDRNGCNRVFWSVSRSNINGDSRDTAPGHRPHRIARIRRAGGRREAEPRLTHQVAVREHGGQSPRVVRMGRVCGLLAVHRCRDVRAERSGLGVARHVRGLRRRLPDATDRRLGLRPHRRQAGAEEDPARDHAADGHREPADGPRPRLRADRRLGVGHPPPPALPAGLRPRGRVGRLHHLRRRDRTEGAPRVLDLGGVHRDHRRQRTGIHHRRDPHHHPRRGRRRRVGMADPVRARRPARPARAVAAPQHERERHLRGRPGRGCRRASSGGEGRRRPQAQRDASRSR